MEVNLNRLTTDQILSGLCMITVLAMWHSDLPSISSPMDLRVIQRAAGDKFLEMALTNRNLALDEYHLSDTLDGCGLYDLVRIQARRLVRFLPATGQQFVLDFPLGSFRKKDSKTII